MSRMLSLHASGFVTAAALVAAGRRTEARLAYDSLLDRPTITVEETVQTHLAAAKLAHSVEQYRRARRHLRAAARLRPQDATIQYDLGRAFESDPYGCDRRAAKRFRKASLLNANEPIYRASLGRAMIRIRELSSGVKVLLRAASSAPTDLNVLDIVADGLREAGRTDDAFRVLSKARFLAPKDAGIDRLWSRAKYDLAVERQRTRPANRPQRDMAEGSTLRLRVESERDGYPAGTRLDRGSRPAAHIGRLRMYNSDLG
jgi:Flp pilus assembly protein TadD